MRVSEEKKPEMPQPETKSIGRDLCEVAMCTETGTRVLSKNKFQSRVCPFHHRFVFTLPFMHRCQYLKSVVDEEILSAYVLQFQPGSSYPTAQQQLPEDSSTQGEEAELNACCDNRATRVLLVGDDLKHCKVYLFCHGHDTQVRAQACGSDAKPSTAKNEPYLSGALCTTEVDEDDTRTASPQPRPSSPLEGSTSGESANSSVSMCDSVSVGETTVVDVKGKGVETPSKIVTFSVKYDHLPSELEKYRRGLRELAAVLEMPLADSLLQLEQKIDRELMAASGQCWPKAREGLLVGAGDGGREDARRPDGRTEEEEP
ncbi:hypothetical protein PG991_006102 [Apiospora marii]|uniref:Uncharacterized protein n=1 Tax=Apiospora marii TaxID=335849 RepID=A0ABR1SB24_9PEZI